MQADVCESRVSGSGRCEISDHPVSAEGLESLEAPEAHQNLGTPHIVILGDSTVDNGRYLSPCELSVEKQLSKRCGEHGWEMTVLAQDGSMLQDVLLRQVPLIPDQATHIVMSCSGNDLLMLLNQMVVSNFTAASMYSAIGEGLKAVSHRYRDLIAALAGLGCHVACCSVYRPNFSHIFFKTLAIFSLGLHNSRIAQISVDHDCSLIDLANLFDGPEDFATPLELSTCGGSKVVENISDFVRDHPVMSLRRYRHDPKTFPMDDDDALLPVANFFGVPARCCAVRTPKRKIYTRKTVSKALRQPDKDLAGDGRMRSRLSFSEAQEHWRES